MLLAGLLAAVGLYSVAAITQIRGLRLGGTIVIGVLAVYALKQFFIVPIFVISTLIAYLAIRYIRGSTLLFGRDELVVGLAAGSLIPLGILLVAFLLPQPVEIELYRAGFIGSILPGLAAYNHHQLQPEYRRRDLVAMVGLLGGILAIGFVLVSPQTTWLAQHTPLVLFAGTSDIAVFRNAVVDGFLGPQIATRPHLILILAASFGLAEASRREFGLRLGTISLGLLAIYTISSWRFPVLFLVTAAIVYGLIEIVHRQGMLYGRVLLGLGAGTGVILTIIVGQYLDPIRGFSALVVGLLAGITAYNFHGTPGLERRQLLSLSAAIYTGMLLVVRGTVAPFQQGFPQEFGLLQIGIGILVIVVGIVVARYYQIDKPSDEAVLSASVLTGGQG